MLSESFSYTVAIMYVCWIINRDRLTATIISLHLFHYFHNYLARRVIVQWNWRVTTARPPSGYGTKEMYIWSGNNGGGVSLV
jgi:hypothetical protein